MHLFGTQKKGHLKIIHDENNVPKDHEFVTVRDFLKSSKHVYTYKINITVDLGKVSKDPNR